MPRKRLTIKIEKEIFLEMVEEIIVTALEGGSNYWYFIKDMPDFPDKTMTLSENIADSLYHNPGFSLDIYDVENPDDKLGTLTQESLLNALETCHREYSNIFYDLLEGTGDAETADVIFQLAVMGELVFG